MEYLLDLRPGKWNLLIVPRHLRSNVLEVVGHFAEKSPLLVLDGGNQFNAYKVSRTVHGRTEVLDRIYVSRAFTCYQMVSLLEGLPNSSTPVICLDFLSTFFDEAIPARERQRLLESCIPHFSRLGKSSGLLVVISVPKVFLPENGIFLDLLQKKAGNIWMPEMPEPEPEPLRLF